MVQIQRKVIAQVGVLLAARVLSILIGVLTSSLNTKILKPMSFGQLSFLINLNNTIQLLSSPGLFHTSSRILALNNARPSLQKGIMGALLVITLFISVIDIVILFAYSFVNDSIFSNNLNEVIRLVCVFVFIFPSQLCINGILQGLNKIFSYSIFILVPYMVNAGLLYFLYYVLQEELLLHHVLLINYSCLSLNIVIFWFVLKPSFKKLTFSIRLLFSQNKNVGSYLYYSILVVGGVTYLGNYIVSYHLGTTHYGFYALAFTLAYPMNLVPSTIGTIFFKSSVNESRYSKSAEYLMISLSLLSLIFFLLILKPIFAFFYTQEYQQSLYMAYMLAVPALVQGLGDFYIKFLIAHGQGKNIFLIASANGFLYIVSIYYLVLNFDLRGVIIGQFITSSIYFVGMFWIYKKITAK